MKSQVNNLLHVVRALVLRDFALAYPMLEGDFRKDYESIALLCQTRGLGLFTLDLPHLSSLLLSGLRTGRLSLEGPLSQRVSKRIHVPRLFSGLWLRVFDSNGICLEHGVDVTALAFLLQVLNLGKKIEVECTKVRRMAAVGAYHDIERQLRLPSLDWLGDELGLACAERRGLISHVHSRDSYLEFLLRQEEGLEAATYESEYRRLVPPMHLHLVQARDWSPQSSADLLPLFASQKVADEAACQLSVEEDGLLRKIQEVADLIVGSFTPLDPVIFSDFVEQYDRGIGFRHGPGAVAERKKQWEKSHFDNWPLKLEGTFPYKFCGTVASNKEGLQPLNHEVASRLIGVPKTAKGPRLIAAEPTSHQWCQQLLLRYLFDQCEYHLMGDFIDFRNQAKSGALVLDASRDGKLATVDLSDASDRLTCWTVERVFRSNPSILRALHAARTRFLRDEISAEGGFLSLRKFASQGTATTFPVMSLVMLCIALGSTLGEKERVDWPTIRKYRNQVRVFGDDIILPTHGYERLLRAMALLQLKVNVAKSYATGFYRESCGTDGYLGYDVAPAKPVHVVADSPTSCLAVLDNVDNLFEKGYFHASTAMFSLLPVRLQRRIRVVGPHDVGVRGVTSFSGGDERHLKERWNTRLHRWEVRVLGLRLRTKRHQRDGLPAQLDWFASSHNPGHARIVSEYADSRKVSVDLLWEPSYYHGHPVDGRTEERSSGQTSRSNRVVHSERWTLQYRTFDTGGIQPDLRAFHLGS